MSTLEDMSRICLPEDVLWNVARLSRFLLVSCQIDEQGSTAKLLLSFDKTTLSGEYAKSLQGKYRKFSTANSADLSSLQVRMSLENFDPESPNKSPLTVPISKSNQKSCQLADWYSLPSQNEKLQFSTPVSSLTCADRTSSPDCCDNTSSPDCCDNTSSPDCCDNTSSPDCDRAPIPEPQESNLTTTDDDENAFSEVNVKQEPDWSDTMQENGCQTANKEHHMQGADHQSENAVIIKQEPEMTVHVKSELIENPVEKEKAQMLDGIVPKFQTLSIQNQHSVDSGDNLDDKLQTEQGMAEATSQTETEEENNNKSTSREESKKGKQTRGRGHTEKEKTTAKSKQIKRHHRVEYYMDKASKKIDQTPKVMGKYEYYYTIMDSQNSSDFLIEYAMDGIRNAEMVTINPVTLTWLEMNASVLPSYTRHQATYRVVLRDFGHCSGDHPLPRHTRKTIERLLD